MQFPQIRQRESTEKRFIQLPRLSGKKVRNEAKL